MDTTRDFLLQQYLPFTVLKHAMVLGTLFAFDVLQQYLPFTVLKQFIVGFVLVYYCSRLQQYLPFTVLKLGIRENAFFEIGVATVLTVYGIETIH